MLIMSKRIPEETKQRAVRVVLEHLDEYPNLTVACETVSQRLGFGAESLRRWVRQARWLAGTRAMATTPRAAFRVSPAEARSMPGLSSSPSRFEWGLRCRVLAPVHHAGKGSFQCLVLATCVRVVQQLVPEQSLVAVGPLVGVENMEDGGAPTTVGTDIHGVVFGTRRVLHVPKPSQLIVHRKRGSLGTPP
jgi:transposase